MFLHYNSHHIEEKSKNKNMSMKPKIILQLVHLICLVVFAAAGKNECVVTRCKHNGPIIRFPFRLKEQPEHCGYPGFQLYCHSYDKRTMLEFQYESKTSLRGLYLSFSVNASVRSIDYKNRLMKVDVDTKLQLQQQLLNPQSSTPFRPQLVREEIDVAADLYGYKLKYTEFTFLNCSTKNFDDIMVNKIDDFRGVYAISSRIKTFQAPLKSCTKMFNISLVPYSFLLNYWLYDPPIITWTTPDCGHCEAKRQYCRLRNNSSSYTTTKRNESTTICFPKDHEPPRKAILAGKIGGLFIIGLILIACYYVIKTYKQKKEGQLKIEMFLADYRALKPTRYSYTDIKKITNQFKEKLGQGGYGSVYKGQLSADVLVAVKILNKMDSKGNGEEFINEVRTIGLIHHVNVVRLVGYCADGSTRALVYEYLPNNSLEKYVYSGRNQDSRFLGWEKLQKIALGIAKGIEYLHQGCAQRILHFDIKPHNILLDQNFNPKISDFGLAKLCSKGLSAVSMTMARGTIGYIAPEVFSRNFGKVSSKSDVYSFGMLLLEMVGARNNAPVGTESSDETYFPEWIFHRLEQGRELTIQIDQETDNNIARKLTIVGLWCIGWHPVDRPSMKHAIQMLEGDDCPAIPPNPFSSTHAIGSEHARPFTQELEAISESE